MSKACILVLKCNLNCLIICFIYLNFNRDREMPPEDVQTYETVKQKIEGDNILHKSSLYKVS